MINIIMLSLVYVGAIVAHWWVALHLSVYGINPWIMLVAAFSVAALQPPVAGIAFGFMGGLYLDFMGEHLFGGYAFCFTVCSYVVWLLRRRIDFSSALSQIIMVLAFSFMAMTLYMLLGLLLMGKALWPGFAGFAGTAALNAVISPVVYFIIDRMSARICP